MAMFGGTDTAIAELSPPPLPRIDLHNQSLSTLEQRLKYIDTQLSHLAHYSLRSGIGTVGYRSLTHNNSTSPEWIKIKLAQESPIDQIVLVPTIWRDTEEGFRDDGFPLEFRILAGTDKDPNGVVIATYGAQDRLLPRIAPLVIPCNGTKASWIRLEASTLSPRAWDGKYVLQLSEILVFNGEEDIALKQPVETSPGSVDQTARKRQALVDGFVPYLMNAAQGKQSIAFVSKRGIGDQPTLMIDLGSIYTLNRLHLHATDLSDTVPTSTPAGFGIPKRLLIEGATQPDYSDAVQLVDFHNHSVFDTGPIIMQRFPDTPCRYVRFTALEPYKYIGDPSLSLIGFAEIELFNNGQNVALGKPVQANFDAEGQNRTFSALTDGYNLYGKILPVRTWFNELACRHDLETERPLLLAELSDRYARQNLNLRMMSWLAAILAVGIVFTILIERIIRMRQLTRIKERFAADLHDELGANLHTIGLLGDLAKEAIDSPDELIELLDRSRVFTERSGAAARYCTNMLEANGLCEDLVDEMKRASSRLLADLDYNLSFEGEDILHRLKPRKRIDLFFFYKECITNIIRHSGATKVTAQMTATNKIISLTVTDNGYGMGGGNEKEVPPSLKRRARLLGARVSAERPKENGMRIVLKLKNNRFGVHR